MVRVTLIIQLISLLINFLFISYWGYPEGSWASEMALVVKNLPVNSGDVKRPRFSPGVKKISWRRAWQPTSVFLPGESCGQRSLAEDSL